MAAYVREYAIDDAPVVFDVSVEAGEPPMFGQPASPEWSVDDPVGAGAGVGVDAGVVVGVVVSDSWA